MSHGYVSMFPCLHVSGIRQMENGTNGRQLLPFVCFKRKTETENFCLFAAKDINIKCKCEVHEKVHVLVHVHIHEHEHEHEYEHVHDHDHKHNHG
jgi:hypothetical protein